MSRVGWVSEIGDKIRVLGTRIVREDWVADFGWFGGSFGLVVGFGGNEEKSLDQDLCKSVTNGKRPSIRGPRKSAIKSRLHFFESN